MPLSGPGADLLEGLEAAFSGLSVGGPEGKEKGKEKEAVDMRVEEEDPADEHNPSDEVLFDDKPAEMAQRASGHPAILSPTTTTLPVAHPTTFSPTTTPPMADGLGFTGMPYVTYRVTPAATAPPKATAVSKPVASSSTYSGVHEPAPIPYTEGYNKPPAPVVPTYIPGYAAPESGYIMPAPGFGSLSGLRRPESCGGRSRGSGRSSNRSMARSETTKALRSAAGELVADMTQEIRNNLKP